MALKASVTSTSVSTKTTDAPNENNNNQSNDDNKTTPKQSTPKQSTKTSNKNRKNRTKPLTLNGERFEIRKLFQRAKKLERQGHWSKATGIYHEILERDPHDSYSYLALARLYARRGQHAQAQETFQQGTTACPKSIHLWQAWAVQQQTAQHWEHAQQLFEQALALDPNNPYVCHAYGLFHKNCLQNTEKAQQLWQRALQKHSTAALVCSLGESWIAQGHFADARNLYVQHAPHVRSAREQTEIYLALAWLEERYLHAPENARTWIHTALQANPSSSVAQVAMARLEGRLHIQRQQQRQLESTTNTDSSRSPVGATVRQLKQAVRTEQDPNAPSASLSNSTRTSAALPEASSPAPLASATDSVTTKKKESNLQQSALPQDPKSREHHSRKRRHKDGRVYNAWAKIEVQAKRYQQARKILRQGLQRHKRDFNLLQAAGKVEELLHNFDQARALYSESLWVQPSAPTLVAYALLELNHPENTTLSSTTDITTSSSNVVPQANYTRVKGLFEEALLVDPRHGPAYNSYGNAEMKRGNVEEARAIFERGVRANCSDAASVYHGYAKLELSLGNVSKARSLLQQGLAICRSKIVGMDSPHYERACFLVHTAGMLELNSDKATEARQVFLDGIDQFGNFSSYSTSQLYLGLALSESKLGNEAKARKYFEQAVNVNERHAQAWQAWGVMEMRAGNLATARTLLECGIRSNPRHGALWLAFATLEGRCGNVDQSRNLFTRGLQKAPQHTPLLQAWASLELRSGNVSAARTLITESLTRDKHKGSGWLVAAEIERRSGNSGLVNLILRRGIECVPTCVDLYKALGDALFAQGKVSEAREIYERGMDMDPQHAPLYHSLAELEAQVFNVEGLAKLNKRAAKIFTPDATQRVASGDDLWSNKIRAGRMQKLPPKVAALAQRIVKEDNDYTVEDQDPDKFLENMSSSLIEGGLIGDLLLEEDETT